MIILLPFLIAGLAAVWWRRRRGGGARDSSKIGAGGRIRLPDSAEEGESTRSEARRIGGNAVAVLASVPWFVVGVVGVFVGWAKEVEIPWLSERLRRSTRGGYRLVYHVSFRDRPTSLIHICAHDRSVHLDDDAE